MHRSAAESKGWGSQLPSQAQDPLRLRSLDGLALLVCLALGLYLLSGTASGDQGWLMIAAALSGSMMLFAAARQTPAALIHLHPLRRLPGLALLLAAVMSQFVGLALGGSPVAASIAQLALPFRQVPSAGLAVLLAAALAAALVQLVGSRQSPIHALIGALIGAHLAFQSDQAVLDSLPLLVVWGVAPLAAAALVRAFLASARSYAAGGRSPVPAVAAILAGSVVVYLLMAGLSRFAYVSWSQAVFGGLVTAACVWVLMVATAPSARAAMALPALPLAPVLCLWLVAQGANDIAAVAGVVGGLAGTAGEGDMNWLFILGPVCLAGGLIAARRGVAPLWDEDARDERVARLSWSLLAAALAALVASALGLPVSVLALTAAARLAAGPGADARRAGLGDILVAPFAGLLVGALLAVLLTGLLASSP